MRHWATFLILLPGWSLAQSTGRSSQTSSGSCSPNIVSSGAEPVTVQLIGSCNGIDPRVIRELSLRMQKFLAQFPKTIGNLNELLDKKNVELAEKVREVDAWTKKYRELSQRLEEQLADDELSKGASDALKEGDLSRAEALLKDLLSKGERQIDSTARNHFSLAGVYELRFQPLLALPEYEKAYRYRPLELSYAFSYASILDGQNRHTEAEQMYLAALRNARDLPTSNKDAYVASVLNRLGVLYRDTQRYQEAEALLTECVELFRELGKRNAAIYPPDISKFANFLNLPTFASALNAIGVLYMNTNRVAEAEAYETESLTIFRELARSDVTYRREVAAALHNFAALLNATHRVKEAEAAYTESLTIQQELAKENQPANLSGIASTLNNLGLLYADTQRLTEGEAAFNESLTIYRELAKENAAAFVPYVATALNNLGNLYSRTRRLKEAEDAYNQALTIRRKLAKENIGAYLLDLAGTINGLGVLYDFFTKPPRFKEAEAAYTESLAMYRELAKENAAANLPYVGMAVNNLGYLYSRTERLKEAEDAYSESLAIFRGLVKESFLPNVATELANFGTLYSKTQRMVDAEAAFGETLKIRRLLAKENPGLYLPHLATTLNDLGVFYAKTKRMSEAEAAYNECFSIRRQLAKKNPTAYADEFAQAILDMDRQLNQGLDLCVLAEEALQVAMSPQLKDAAVSMKQTSCVPPK
jgi:hypothetical protein